MAFPKQIETDHLILRPYGPEHLDAHVKILGNWEVTQWLSTNVPFPYHRKDGEAFIKEAKSQFDDGSSIRYGIEDKVTGQHIGGIRIFSVTPETEVGYWLDPDFWGKGYGTQILNAAITAGFDTGIITCFVAQTASKNKGSRRILEKVGFRHAGKPPPEYARCGHNEGCSEYYRLEKADFSKYSQGKDV